VNSSLLLQAVGFLACFVLFLVPACLWDSLTGSKTGGKVFQFIYFFSSFWNQFGPNCTTFLVAGQRLLYMLCMLCCLHAGSGSILLTTCFAKSQACLAVIRSVYGLLCFLALLGLSLVRRLLTLLCLMCLLCFQKERRS